MPIPMWSSHIGNCYNNGSLRYYWQCSCEVFAHGPEYCPSSPSSFDYSCPGDFDGSSDSVAMRNVYERWGPALENELRMACGSSTSAYCHEGQTDRIWDNYNNQGMDVADSFIFGLHDPSNHTSNVVPLCITTSVWWLSSPLFDETFTNLPNPAASESNPYFHIQYLDQFASNGPIWGAFTTPPDLFLVLPIIRFIPRPDPPPFDYMEFYQRGDLRYSRETVKGRGSRVRINDLSNAIYIRGELKKGLYEAELTEEDYLYKAVSFLKEQALYETNMMGPLGTKVIIERISKDDGNSDMFLKNVMITFKRRIQLDDRPINILGPGGKISVQMNNDGSVLNLTKVWRKINPYDLEYGKRYRVKSFDEALGEARQQIEDPMHYKLANWNWGYKEASGNVKQDEMHVVFQFWFEPEEQQESYEFPPRIIEVKGQDFSSEVVEVDMDLNTGWQMISLPVVTDSLVLSNVFPEAVVVYGYEKNIGYKRVKEGQALEVGKGYWLLLDEAN